MVERVARALAKDDGAKYENHPATYKSLAIAALDAMREPSEAMIAKGISKMEGFAKPSNKMCNGYRAMIDEALKEV